MSKSAIQAFMDKLSQDEALRAEMREKLSAGGTKQTASVDELVEFASAHGFSFGADEALASMELNDQELDKVAGGGNFERPNQKQLPMESLSLNYTKIQF
jgi:predicted ribosomally synthesized peptide with nif11-like leader